MSCKAPATCPSWWDCVKRGCYELAKGRYASERERPKWETDQNGNYDMNPRTGGRLRPGR
jgi:hypothetical protein